MAYIACRLVLGPLPLPLVVLVGYLIKGGFLAIMLSLSCSSVINALYLVAFDTINSVADTTIVRVVQLTSVTSSIAFCALQAVYRVTLKIYLTFVN